MPPGKISLKPKKVGLSDKLTIILNVDFSKSKLLLVTLVYRAVFH